MNTELRVLRSGPDSAAFNMALDEALLITSADRGCPVLRLYAWTERAATFGYFQHLADIERATLLRPLIRRPTGGGLVPHDRDWTYSLTVPPGLAWHELRAIESYRTIHDWVVEAFSRLGVATQLAECCRKDVPGQCFQGWEKLDVLWEGRKIAGAAQRRNRLGLLIQGSVQPPPGCSRDAWEAALVVAAPTPFFESTASLTPDKALLTLASHLAETRYSQDIHNAAR